MRKKIGILIHGLHLQAQDWESVVWGNPPHTLGSLPKAVQVMLDLGLENIGHVVFGTGASEKDGMKEAAYTKRELYNKLERLDDYPELFMGPVRRYGLSKLIEHASLEIKAKNTAEEIKNVAQWFSASECDLVIQIPTCASHAPRCLKTFLQVKAQGGIPEGQSWMVATPDTTFAGSTIDDVAIVEPPHRGDDPMLDAPVKAHEVVSRLFRLSPQDRKNFLLQADQLLREKFGA